MFATILSICQRVLYRIFYFLFVGSSRKDPRTSRVSTTSASWSSMFKTTLAANRRTEGLLKYPVVIIHGFADRPTLTGIENVAETVLSELGIDYYVPEIQPFGSIFERTESLIKQIANKYPRKTVHFITHSMGGLNARDITSLSMTKNLGFKVKTVTTLATPHRGIQALDIIPNFDDTSGFSTILRDLIGSDLGAAGDLSRNAMIEFNRTHQSNPDVKYFTWAGEIDLPSPLFTITFPFTRPFGPTDGLINVESATWGPDLGGPGTHLGTLRGADHAGLVGRTTILGSLPHIRAAEVGEEAVVQKLDNSLVSSIFRSISGTINSLLGPIRAILTDLGLLGVAPS